MCRIFIDPKQLTFRTMIEQLAKQLMSDVQSVLGSNGQASADPSKLKALIESALRKLNLVSREEFDAQTAVLQRTRAKLEALEAALAELEQAEDVANKK